MPALGGAPLGIPAFKLGAALPPTALSALIPEALFNPVIPEALPNPVFPPEPIVQEAAIGTSALRSTPRAAELVSEAAPNTALPRRLKVGDDKIGATAFTVGAVWAAAAL